MMTPNAHQPHLDNPHPETQGLSRRNFVRRVAGGASGILLGSGLRGLTGPSEPLRIEEPFHGAVLNRRLGREVPGGLEIRVCGEAPAGERVTINGMPVERAGKRFETKLVLRHHETEIAAASEGDFGRREHQVRVVWDRHSRPRYRFAIDDNSFFLRDIYRKQYGSLFDCFYLKLLRDLHERYGTCFVLNLFFQTADGFTLRQFPDRYRGEWKDNAHWLKLAFHALANDPDRPYQTAPVERLLSDFDKVGEQIHRFAGAATYSPPTIIHWGMTPPEALNPLYGRGVRALSGYFRKLNGVYDVNYRLDDERSEYLFQHDALKDFASGIVFSKVDIICNSTPISEIVPTLASAGADPNRAEIIDILTHEQYFWPFYHNYIPDHGQRLETAIRWVTEHGYQPVFLHEGFLGQTG